MTRANGSASIMQPIIVGVVLALLVGGSAPWWWGEIRPGGSSAEVTTTTQAAVTAPTTGGTTSSGGPANTSSGAGEAIDVTDCQITIRNPLVSLREEPDHFALEVGRVEPGSYPVSEATIVDRGLGQERWFRIAANGRTGWLEDNSILVDSKSAGCP